MTALSPTAPLRALGRASLHGLQALGGTALFLLEGIAQIFSGSKILPRTCSRSTLSAQNLCFSFCSSAFSAAWCWGYRATTPWCSSALWPCWAPPYL